MSYHPSAQIKALTHAIADIHIPATCDDKGPRPIGEILRPFLAELRRSRMTGESMRREILARFAAPAESTIRG